MFLLKVVSLETKYNNDLRGLAEIDAHSVELALSVHYDLSDITDGPLVKKKHQSFLDSEQEDACCTS